jgi:hypothetical protein
MMHDRRLGLATGLTLLLALALPAAAQQDPRGNGGRGRELREYTFRLDVTAPDGSDTGRSLRSIELTGIEREKVSFHFGTKTPIPTTTFNPSEGMDAKGQAVPRISYSYQDLGLQVDLRVLQQSGGLVFVALEYELSYTEPQAAAPREGQPPLIPSHEVKMIRGLKASAPVVAAEFFRPEEGRVLAESLGIDPGAMGGTGPWRLLLTLVEKKD